MQAIKRNPSLSVVKMVKELGISNASIERALKSLKDKKLIAREGATKNGHWIVLK